jgi:hypothetical protein
MKEMVVDNKAELIYRSIVIILFIVLLAVFCQYSENGRYTYHKEIYNTTNDKYVADSRTGTIYGYYEGETFAKTYFYKIELQTGKVLYKDPQVIDMALKKPKPSPSK